MSIDERTPSTPDPSTGQPSDAGRRSRPARWVWWTVGLLVATIVATVVSVFATSTPQEAAAPCAAPLHAGSPAGGETRAPTAGTLWAWGIEYADPANRTVAPAPQQVPGLTAVTAAAGFDGGGYALEADGTVWAWGDGHHGQLGNGAFANSSVPVQVSGLTGVTAISAADATGYALLPDGTVRAWGWGESGELGINQDSSAVPVQVPG